MILPVLGSFSPPRQTFFPTKFIKGIITLVPILKAKFVPRGFPFGGAYETLYSVIDEILVLYKQKRGQR
jgi:hypothetical protein